MKMVKSMVLILMLATLFTTVSSAAVMAGSSYYTKVNIWYETPERIPSTNYHVGSILPVGTKVDLLKVSDGKVVFRDSNGTTYTIEYLAKFTGPVAGYLDKFFSAENVLKSEAYKKMSDKDKENIAAGNIIEGMSKEAVLMAYGNPPTHRTPSTSNNRWTYWVNRFKTMVVVFGADDMVSMIQK